MNKFFLLMFLIPSVCFGQAISYDKIILTPTNTVTFRGEVTDSSVQKIQFALMDASMYRALRGKPTDVIYLVMDSPGGSIDAGVQLIEFAKTIPNLSTITIFGASMASAIVEHLPGERLVTNNAWLMFHRARGGFQGQFEMGEVETRLAMAKRLVLKMEITNSQRMRMSLKDYKRLVKDELWLDAEQSILFRAADRIVDIYCSPTLILTKDSVNIDSMFGSLNLQFSACPLFRMPVGASANRYKVPTMSNYKDKK